MVILLIDFINCAEHLIEGANITNASLLACEGRSAGGLLIGSIVNMRPDLFKIAVAGVPFVDVCNTMSDPSIPLTTGEWYACMSICMSVCMYVCLFACLYVCMYVYLHVCIYVCQFALVFNLIWFDF